MVIERRFEMPILQAQLRENTATQARDGMGDVAHFVGVGGNLASIASTALVIACSE